MPPAGMFRKTKDVGAQQRRHPHVLPHSPGDLPTPRHPTRLQPVLGSRHGPPQVTSRPHLLQQPQETPPQVPPKAHLPQLHLIPLHHLRPQLLRV